MLSCLKNIFLFCLLFFFIHLNPASFTIIKAEIYTLGTLGGSESYALDISSNGEIIVGYSANSENKYRAFKYSNSKITSLGVLEGGHYSYANGINADGSIIVGHSDTKDGITGFIYQNEQMISLGIPFDYEGSIARNLNDDGSIIIGELIKDETHYPAIYVNKNWKILDIKKGYLSVYLRDISNDETIVGFRENSQKTYNAFQFNIEKANDENFNSNALQSKVFSTTNDGEISVGYLNYQDDQGLEIVQAAKFSNGSFITLGVLPGGTNSKANGISGDGSTIVGYSNTEDGDRAVAFINNQIINIDSFDNSLGSFALNTNYNGSVIIGYSIFENEHLAFVYKDFFGQMRSAFMALHLIIVTIFIKLLFREILFLDMLNKNSVITFQVLISQVIVFVSVNIIFFGFYILFRNEGLNGSWIYFLSCFIFSIFLIISEFILYFKLVKIDFNKNGKGISLFLMLFISLTSIGIIYSLTQSIFF